MRLKIFKKKIETILFKRMSDEKKYLIFSSGVKNNFGNFQSSNILNYSVKYSLQQSLQKPVINNFLTSSFVLSPNELNVLLKHLKNNINLIYFIKFKNLYFFNIDSVFKSSFTNLNMDAYSFIARLQKLTLNWLPHLKLVLNDNGKTLLYFIDIIIFFINAQKFKSCVN